MKPNFNTKEELARYFKFEPASKLDAERLEKAWAMYQQDYKGDGVMGCCAEVLRATSGSKKMAVSNAGRVDCRILYRSKSGAVIPVACESKTNLGRIETTETEYSKAEVMEGRYVIYSMDICNRGTNNCRRRVSAVVIPRRVFTDKLLELNAVKAIKRKNKKTGEVYLDGYCIQATSKKLWLWLDSWPIKYDRNAVYCDDDFEGLE